MDESMICECGQTKFWYFPDGDLLRCASCFNEYKNRYVAFRKEYWMRRFNKEDNCYPENWEKFDPECFTEKEREELIESNIEFEDQHLTGCEVNECQDGSVAAFLQLDFGQLVGGSEVLLTEKELESMLQAVRNEDSNVLFGPVLLGPDDENDILAPGALNIDNIPWKKMVPVEPGYTDEDGNYHPPEQYAKETECQKQRKK